MSNVEKQNVVVGDFIHLTVNGTNFVNYTPNETHITQHEFRLEFTNIMNQLIKIQVSREMKSSLYEKRIPAILSVLHFNENDHQKIIDNIKENNKFEILMELVSSESNDDKSEEANIKILDYVFSNLTPILNDGVVMYE